MIGPGWMPSRPRPLGRTRRGSLLGSSWSVRRRARRTRSRGRQDGSPRWQHAAVGAGYVDAPVELPRATVLAMAHLPRHRVIAGDLLRWLAARWSWLRPRSVPITVAFAGMLAMVSAVRQLSAYAGGDLAAAAPAHHAAPAAPVVPTGQAGPAPLVLTVHSHVVVVHANR